MESDLDEDNTLCGDCAARIDFDLEENGHKKDCSRLIKWYSSVATPSYKKVILQRAKAVRNNQECTAILSTNDGLYYYNYQREKETEKPKKADKKVLGAYKK